MDFQLNEEQSMFKDSVRRFMEDNCSFDKRGTVAEKGAFDKAHWQMFAELGLLGLALPEEQGGLGYSAIETALVMEEMGRVLCVEPYWAIAVLAAQTLLASKDDKASDILQALAVGDAFPVLAHEEAPARGSLSFVKTRATSVEGGRWRLSGEKVSIVAGNIADRFIVSARTSGASEDKSGITLFLVQPDAKGLHKRDLRLIDNRWAAHLVLDGVEVGPEDVLGVVGEGYAALDHAHAQGLVAMCAEALGVMEQALWTTRDYLKIRKQFGQTLSTFQSLQHRMSEMLIELELSRGMVYYALSNLKEPGQVREHALSATKAHVGKSGMFVCGQSIQLHGGIGVTEEYVIGHHFKRMTLISNALGSTALHFERMAEMERSAG
jgi:alkylation response protein AidB-like acyl-CoA dehydrogenase